MPLPRTLAQLRTTAASAASRSPTSSPPKSGSTRCWPKPNAPAVRLPSEGNVRSGGILRLLHGSRWLSLEGRGGGRRRAVCHRITRATHTHHLRARMRDSMRTLFAVLSLSTGLGSGGAAAAPPLRLVQAIPLDGVEGRIDHLAADTKGQRLFVAALGNGTVEVVDLRSGRRSRRLRGFHEPQGLGFVASPSRLFVANGADGTCEVLHGETFTHLRTLRFSADADNVRYDP